MRLVQVLPHARLRRRLEARAAQEAEVQAAQRIRLPGGARREVVGRIPGVSAPEDRLASVEALRTARPGRDRAEVEELRDRPRRRRHPAGRGHVTLVELVAVHHVRLQLELGVVPPRPKLGREPREACRVVELVSVDAERPGRGAHVRLERRMRGCGVARPANLEVVELLLEGVQDLRGPIAGHVVDGVDAVADAGDVPDRALEEHVLVAYKDDPDHPDAAHGVSGCPRPRPRLPARRAAGSSTGTGRSPT